MFRILVLIFIAAVMMTACGKGPDWGIAPTEKGFNNASRYITKVDILWIVDNSDSMKQHQDLISDQTDVFIDSLVAGHFDFQIAVVTTDLGHSDGEFQGDPKVLTPGTPDLKAKLKQRFQQGEGGSDVEQGLESVKRSLSTEKQTGLNKGFLREGATLVVIALSNEEDQSVGTASDYINFFDKLKTPYEDGTRAWLMNYIGVLNNNSSCQTSPRWGYTRVGFKYMALADETKGIKESICTADFRATLTNIRLRIVKIMTDYHLDRVPVIGSITVYIDGKQIEEDPDNGWSYDADTNTISFHGESIPGADENILVNYQPAEIKH